MTPQARRNAMLACSVGIHALVLVGLLLWGASTPDRRTKRGVSLLDTYSVRDGEAQPEQKAPKPAVEVSSRPTAAAFVVKLPMIAQVAASSGEVGEPCQIAAAVQADLLADEAARNELTAIPFAERSVANAVVLWTAAPDHVRPLLPVTEQLIFERLRLTLAECLDVDQAGPDFLYVTTDNRTVAIAIGSGQWRWRTYFDALTVSMQQLEPESVFPVPAG